MASLENVNADELLRELRAREFNSAGGASAELLVAVYGPPSQALKDVATAELIATLRDRQKVIYGTDDRQDLFELVNPALLRNAQAIVALFEARNVIDKGDGTCALQLARFGDRFRLCPAERFVDQPCGAFGSGVLVAPDIIATAGHCVPSAKKLEGIRFIFGFQMLSEREARRVVSNEDIYKGVELLHRVEDPNGADWALVRLDRAAAGRPLARLRRTGTPVAGDAVYVIGHPCGLPAKYAGGASIQDDSPASFFAANLDTYGGNSGSPVFNASHEVEGLLVRGSTDFVLNGHCYVSLVIPQLPNGAPSRAGEHCTRVKEFIDRVPPPTGTEALPR